MEVQGQEISGSLPLRRPSNASGTMNPVGVRRDRVVVLGHEGQCRRRPERNRIASMRGTSMLLADESLARRLRTPDPCVVTR